VLIDFDSLRRQVFALEAELQAGTAAAAAMVSRLAAPSARRAFWERIEALRPLLRRYDLASRHFHDRVQAIVRPAARRELAGHLSSGRFHDHRRYADQARWRLAQWNRTEALLDRVMGLGRRRAPPVPLLRPAAPPDIDPVAAQGLVANRLYQAMHAELTVSSQDESARLHNCFPDIAYAVSTYLAALHAALRLCLAQDRPGPRRFLDIGCGSGTKVLAAAEMFHEAHGLEYDPGYAARAAQIVGRNRHCRVFQGDALTFDRYGDYDVLFMYQPISDDAILARLERRVVEQARPGTILIAPYFFISTQRDALGLGAVASTIYLTGIGRKATDRLWARAERMGCAIPPLDAEIDRDRLGFLFHLVAACRRQGFDLA